MERCWEVLESSVTAAANETSESARQGEEASGGGAPRVNPTDKSTKQTDEKSGDKESGSQADCGHALLIWCNGFQSHGGKGEKSHHNLMDGSLPFFA